MSIPTRTYTLALPDELAGYTVVMGRPTARELIDIQAGRITDAEQLEIVARHVISQDFGVADILDLEDWIVAELLKAWGNAMRDAALPPANGDS